MNKEEAITILQQLVKSRYNELTTREDSAVSTNDFYVQDMIKEDKKKLHDVFNFLEKEYRDE